MEVDAHPNGGNHRHADIKGRLRPRPQLTQSIVDFFHRALSRLLSQGPEVHRRPTAHIARSRCKRERRKTLSRETPIQRNSINGCLTRSASPPPPLPLSSSITSTKTSGRITMPFVRALIGLCAL